MESGAWRELEALFETVNQLNQAERKTFLKNLQARSPELHDELRSLIDVEAKSFWDVPLFDSRMNEGSRVGPYEIREFLGQGGMGSVYLAQDTGESRQCVALKICAMPILDDASVLRFQAEQRMLAKMNHSYIAKLHACGVTESGFPYFVMEYIPGEHLTVFCDRRKLSIRQRLDLFTKLCEAISHAHLKSVVHRDLKPHNILVVEENGVPIPKVIDFGIAKSMEATRSLTAFGQKLGSFKFMSPEQAGLRTNQQTIDVDSRADIYALGRILYELLIDQPPFLWNRNTTEEEILADLRNKSPIPLHVSWQKLTLDKREQLAQHRSTSVKKLQRLFSSDLSWVLNKVLSKFPEDRYQTVRQFQDDLNNFRNRMPIQAHHPGRFRLMLKFMSRNRYAIGLGAIAATLLLTFAVSMTVMQQKTASERDTAEYLITIMTDMFRGTDPLSENIVFESKDQLTLNRILERGRSAIHADFQHQPQVRSRLLHTMGAIYLNLGRFEDAGKLLQDALRIRRDTFKPNHPKLADTLEQVAIWKRKIGDYDAAFELFQEALSIRERHFRRNPSSLASLLIQIGYLCRLQGNQEQAEEHYRRVLAFFKPESDTDYSILAGCLNNFAILLEEKGDLENALCLLENVLALDREISGEEHPYLFTTYHNLGLIYFRLGQLMPAEWYLRESLQIAKVKFGEVHVEVASRQNTLALILQKMGRFEEAFRLHERALETRLDVYGPEHPSVARSTNNLGFVLHGMGDLSSASHYYNQALNMRRKLFGSNHSDVANSLHNLAFIYSQIAQPKKAEPMFLEAIQILERVSGENLRVLSTFKRNFGNHYFRYGEYQKAKDLLTETIRLRQQAYGNQHPNVASALSLLGEIYMSLGQWDKAHQTLEQACLIYRNANQSVNWRANLAEALFGLVQFQHGDQNGWQEFLENFNFLVTQRGERDESVIRLKRWKALFLREPTRHQMNQHLGPLSRSQ